jgi:hypothetical protein
VNQQCRQAFKSELATARQLYRIEEFGAAFRHLEVAHVLGQRDVAAHVVAHYWMFKIGWKRRSLREVWGQLVRIVLGAAGSALGVVPTGNTGGTDIGMFQRLPIAPDIRELLEK